MSLLTMVQQAMGEIGLGMPGIVVGNGDSRVVQAQALANRSAIELRDATDAADYWQALRQQFLFNMQGLGPFTGTFTPGSNIITGISNPGALAGVGAGWQISSRYVVNDTMVQAVFGGNEVLMSEPANLTATQGAQTDTALAFGQEAYPGPADLNYFIPQTGWDRNFRWQLLGPVDAQEWQVLKSGISPVGPRLRYRLMGNQIYLNPAPYVPVGQASPIADLIVMEYASLNWAGPQGATVPSQATLALDGDVCLAFPEDLIVMALKWRLLKAIGNAYAQEYDEYEDAKNRRTGRETMARNLPLNARASGIRLLSSQNVPDTGFGS